MNEKLLVEAHGLLKNKCVSFDNRKMDHIVPRTKPPLQVPQRVPECGTYFVQHVYSTGTPKRPFTRVGIATWSSCPADALSLAQTTCGCLTASWSSLGERHGRAHSSAGREMLQPGPVRAAIPAQAPILEQPTSASQPQGKAKKPQAATLLVSYAQHCSYSCVCGLQKPYCL